MIDQFDRMKAALGLLAQNLEGSDWVEGLKPISPQFAAEMAGVARAAYFHEPHEKLDQAIAAASENEGKE